MAQRHNEKRKRVLKACEGIDHFAAKVLAGESIRGNERQDSEKKNYVLKAILNTFNEVKVLQAKNESVVHRKC